MIVPAGGQQEGSERQGRPLGYSASSAVAGRLSRIFLKALNHSRCASIGLFYCLQDPAEDLAFPNGVDGIWEVKRGEYVDRPLDLQEMRNLLDGWLSWPAYPANYTGPQITFAYLEGYEGTLLVLHQRVRVCVRVGGSEHTRVIASRPLSCPLV